MGGRTVGAMATTSIPARPQGSRYVDWQLAKSTGRRLVAAGPQVTPRTAATVVAALRAASQQARSPVQETARLHAPEGLSPVLIVDRPGWIDANVDSLSAMLDPVIATMTAKHRAETGRLARGVGSKLTGGEAGAMMAFLASKVLGQFDLAPDSFPRLLLVAPNIVQIETQLGVDPADFRLWVCLHEETHRVQFTAVPWLRDHVISSARTLTTDLVPDADQLGTKLQQIARRLPEAFRSGGSGLTDVFVTPEQRVTMARITAVMSLLEGHADVVMDDVGPQVIPSVVHIRAKFQQHRQGAGSVDRLLRRLLGLEAKMRQYRDGAKFVRHVIDAVGVDDFNAVWTSPETLPLPEEIENPDVWITRVHG